MYELRITNKYSYPVFFYIGDQPHQLDHGSPGNRKVIPVKNPITVVIGQYGHKWYLPANKELEVDNDLHHHILVFTCDGVLLNTEPAEMTQVSYWWLLPVGIAALIILLMLLRR